MFAEHKDTFINSENITKIQVTTLQSKAIQVKIFFVGGGDEALTFISKDHADAFVKKLTS